MNNLIRIPEVDTADLELTGQGIVEKARALVVQDDESYELCGKLILEAKDISKRIKERLADEKRVRHESHRMVCDLETALDAFPKKALEIAEPKWRIYREEAEQKRKIEEARLQEEAKKKEEDATLADAQLAEALGEKDLAEAIIDQAPPPAPVFVPGPPKVKGLSGRTYWKVRVNDKKVLIKFVAENLDQYAAFLDPNETALKNHGKLTEGAVKIPGVDLWEEETPVGRRR